VRVTNRAKITAFAAFLRVVVPFASVAQVISVNPQETSREWNGEVAGWTRRDWQRQQVAGCSQSVAD